MLSLIRAAIICAALITSFLPSQEKTETPANSAATAQTNQASQKSADTQTTAPPPAIQQPPTNPAPQKIEGPEPTEIIAHEHSVTDSLEVIPFTSKIFHNTRMLRVLIPGNYWSPHNRQRKYPVLYLQDGQNIFDKSTSYSGIEWEADETIDRLVGGFKIPPMFVVGFDNAGEQRTSEYLTYPDPHNPQFHSANPPTLEGQKYADFLIKEVMPFLQKRYRIAPGYANTAIGGSSYGAIVSLTAALSRPGVFSKLLLESPSLWVGDGKLDDDVKKAKTLPQKIYIGVGTKEMNDPAYDPEIVKNVTDLEKILKAKGLGPTRLKVVVEEGAAHNEAAWARRFPDAIQFLYGR